MAGLTFEVSVEKDARTGYRGDEDLRCLKLRRKHDLSRLWIWSDYIVGCLLSR